MTYADLTGLSVTAISHADAAAICVRHHYLHRKPPIKYGYGLFHNGRLSGVVTFGTPASRHLQKSLCPSNPNVVVELNRLWVDDHLGRNTESWFVSRALKLMPAHLVVSYADTAYGYMGYVYRALNFRYAGWTDMERKTPRYDYIVPGKHTRDAFRGGYAYKVRRAMKVKYWTVTGDKRERTALLRLSGWPSLNWKDLPPMPMAARDAG